MRWIWLIAAAACSGPTTKDPARPVTPPPPTSPVADKLDLPSIPAKIDVTTSKPTDGNAPDKRSPILDIMKAENEREIGALKKAPEPAYYLAYQLVDQRIVNLEAEGGALI